MAEFIVKPPVLQVSALVGNMRQQLRLAANKATNRTARNLRTKLVREVAKRTTVAPEVVTQRIKFKGANQHQAYAVIRPLALSIALSEYGYVIAEGVDATRARISVPYVVGGMKLAGGFVNPSSTHHRHLRTDKRGRLDQAYGHNVFAMVRDLLDAEPDILNEYLEKLVVNFNQELRTI